MQESTNSDEMYESPDLFEVGSLHDVTQGQLYSSGQDSVQYMGYSLGKNRHSW